MSRQLIMSCPCGNSMDKLGQNAQLGMSATRPGWQLSCSVCGLAGPCKTPQGKSFNDGDEAVAAWNAVVVKVATYDEIQEKHVRIMAETCRGSAATFEQHCTCVSGLEGVIEDQRGQLAALREALESAGCTCDTVWATGGDRSVCKRCTLLATLAGKPQADVLRAAKRQEEAPPLPE